MAGADTLVFTGTNVTLHAKAFDTLGMIVKKEWSIAGGKFATASQQDTTFTAPTTASVLSCILRVTDDDGFFFDGYGARHGGPASRDAARRPERVRRETLPAFKPRFLGLPGHRGIIGYFRKTDGNATGCQRQHEIEGQGSGFGSRFDTLPLIMGLNSFPIAIVAQDTAYKKTYAVQVVKIDDVPPSAPTVSVQDTTAVAVLGRPIWTWVSGGGGGAGYRYKLDDTLMSAGATATVASAFQPDTVTFLKVGYHTLYVQERDSANNWSATGNARIWGRAGLVV